MVISTTEVDGTIEHIDSGARERISSTRQWTPLPFHCLVGAMSLMGSCGALVLFDPQLTVETVGCNILRFMCVQTGVKIARNNQGVNSQTAREGELGSRRGSWGVVSTQRKAGGPRWSKNFM